MIVIEPVELPKRDRYPRGYILPIPVPAPAIVRPIVAPERKSSLWGFGLLAALVAGAVLPGSKPQGTLGGAAAPRKKSPGNKLLYMWVAPGKWFDEAISIPKSQLNKYHQIAIATKSDRKPGRLFYIWSTDAGYARWQLTQDASTRHKWKPTWEQPKRPPAGKPESQLTLFGGKGCRDKKGIFIPIPRCINRPSALLKEDVVRERIDTKLDEYLRSVKPGQKVVVSAAAKHIFGQSGKKYQESILARLHTKYGFKHWSDFVVTMERQGRIGKDKKEAPAKNADDVVLEIFKSKKKAKGDKAWQPTMGQTYDIDIEQALVEIINVKPRTKYVLIPLSPKRTLITSVEPEKSKGYLTIDRKGIVSSYDSKNRLRMQKTAAHLLKPKDSQLSGDVENCAIWIPNDSGGYKCGAYARVCEPPTCDAPSDTTTKQIKVCTKTQSVYSPFYNRKIERCKKYKAACEGAACMTEPMPYPDTPPERTEPADFEVESVARWMAEEYNRETFEKEPLLARGIMSRGGIRSYRKGVEKAEYKGIPLFLKNREGLPLDEMAAEMNYDTSRDLVEAIVAEYPIKAKGSWKKLQKKTWEEFKNAAFEMIDEGIEAGTWSGLAAESEHTTAALMAWLDTIPTTKKKPRGSSKKPGERAEIYDACLVLFRTNCDSPGDKNYEKVKKVIASWGYGDMTQVFYDYKWRPGTLLANLRSSGSKWRLPRPERLPEQMQLLGQDLFPGLHRELVLEPPEDAATSDDPVIACMERQGWRIPRIEELKASISEKLTPDLFTSKTKKLSAGEKEYQRVVQECLQTRSGTAGLSGKRVKYFKGDANSAINAALKTVDDTPLYIFPTAYGYAIETYAPPWLNHYMVHPDGTVESHMRDVRTGKWTVEALKQSGTKPPKRTEPEQLTFLGGGTAYRGHWFFIKKGGRKVEQIEAPLDSEEFQKYLKAETLGTGKTYLVFGRGAAAARKKVADTVKRVTTIRRKYGRGYVKDQPIREDLTGMHQGQAFWIIPVDDAQAFRKLTAGNTVKDLVYASISGERVATAPYISKDREIQLKIEQARLLSTRGAKQQSKRGLALYPGQMPLFREPEQLKLLGRTR